MSNQTRNKEAGIPGNGGQFASVTPLREPDGIDIAAKREESVTSLEREVAAVADEMISYEAGEGAFTVATRQEDAEFEMRDRLRFLSNEEFSGHFDGIAKVAERISIVEHADSTDTDVYEEYGFEYGLEEADFPVEDYEYDGVYNDCAAYRAAVIGELESDLRRRIRAAAEADQTNFEAANTKVPRGA